MAIGDSLETQAKALDIQLRLTPVDKRWEFILVVLRQRQQEDFETASLIASHAFGGISAAIRIRAQAKQEADAEAKRNAELNSQ